MPAWLSLTLAIVFEVIGTTALKLSDGMTKMLPIVVLVVTYALSFWLLALALKRIDVGAAYATWSGLGTALIAMVGFWYFKDPVSLNKILSIALIVIGVIWLNLSGVKH